ncbi:MAG: AsmA-like C-terminal domain-containing protein [Coraliomargaritaceae bacterium]
MHLNYSAKKYPNDNGSDLVPKKQIRTTKLIASSIEENPYIHSIANALSASKNTYIHCLIEKAINESYTLFTEISSESIELYSNKLKSLKIRSQYSSGTPVDSLLFEADNFSNSQLQIQTNSISGKLMLDDEMKIDCININADSIYFKDEKFDSLSGKAYFGNSDYIKIDGYIFHKKHLLGIQTDYQIDARYNEYSVAAHLNLNELKEEYVPELSGLDIPLGNSIFGHSQIILDENINLLEAKGYFQGESIHVSATPFQYIRNDYHWKKTKLKATSSFKINDRNLGTEIEYDAASGNYVSILKGSIFTSDFNSILPKWWQNTYKKFSYQENTKILSDFVINGNINAPIPDLFLGSVQTENLIYRDVPIKYGDLIVKGMNYCTEIALEDVQTETGKAEGVIKITTKPDGIKYPESIRVNLRSELTIKSAQNLFGEDTQKVLSNFDSDYAHKIDFESAYFNPHYTQHKDKSYYNLSINSTHPFSFFNRPFNQLFAKVYGRNGEHYIRSASSEFTNGQLDFEADILETSSNDPQIRLNLKLSDSDYSQCIQDIFQDKFDSVNFDELKQLSLDLTLSSKGSLFHLTKHNGYGDLSINGENLAKIHLLGPFSKALEELKLSIGVFSLNRLETNFLIQKEKIAIENLEIDGRNSHVFGQGKIMIPDQSINLKIKVDLLKNINLSFSNLGNIGKILNPVTKVLNFNVTGTLKNQQWRSIFDPRNLFQ